MATTDKPNILVIWGDDIGITNLSCYSHGLMGYQTPNIDRLAKEGMMFTDSRIGRQRIEDTGPSETRNPGHAGDEPHHLRNERCTELGGLHPSRMEEPDSTVGLGADALYRGVLQCADRVWKPRTRPAHTGHHSDRCLDRVPSHIRC